MNEMIIERTIKKPATDGIRMEDVIREAYVLYDLVKKYLEQESIGNLEYRSLEMERNLSVPFPVFLYQIHDIQISIIIANDPFPESTDNIAYQFARLRWFPASAQEAKKS